MTLLWLLLWLLLRLLLVLCFVHFRGSLKYYIKAYDLAIQDLTKAATIDSTCGLAFFNRAVCYQEHKEYSKVRCTSMETLFSIMLITARNGNKKANSGQIHRIHCCVTSQSGNNIRVLKSYIIYIYMFDKGESYIIMDLKILPTLWSSTAINCNNALFYYFRH